MYAGKIVERTDVDTLFYNPKHPYTKMLLDSIPKMEEVEETLGSIEGIVPSLKNMPKVGCRFAERCPVATDECKRITPKLAEVASGHEVSCLLYKTSYPMEEVK